MQTLKKVGNTVLKVPRLGFGSAPIGNLYSEIPEKSAIDTIQHALQSGINFFDTAPLYGAGLAEKRIGSALRGVDRDQFIIETKVGRLITPDQQVIYDYSHDGVSKSLDASLKRMGIDYVDSLLIHDPDTGSAPAEYIVKETLPTLIDLKRQGIIKSIGVGMNYWEMLLEFAQADGLDCFLLAGRYTLLEQTALNALDTFKAKGISVFAAGVFNSGILATGTRSTEPLHFQYKLASEEIVSRVQNLESVCDQFNVDLPAAAIQFVAAHPAITSLVIGMETTRQVDSAIAYFQQPIPKAFWLELRDQHIINADSPLPLS